jgi:hypothetical protein
MHGGAHGIGAPRGSRNGNYKHGRYTGEMVAARRRLIVMSRVGTKRTSRSRPLRSAFRGKAENICSKRVFRLLTVQRS